MRWALAAVLLLAACVPAIPYDAAVPVVAPEPGFNSPVYAIRPPLPNQPGYLQTIKFIDDGMRYVDQWSRFFVSPRGEMCFLLRPNALQTPFYDNGYRLWCVYPQTVDRVEPATDDVSGVYKVRLVCAHAYPQCVRSHLGWVSNYVLPGTAAYLQERTALESLIRMMGGTVALHPASGA